MCVDGSKAGVTPRDCRRDALQRLADLSDAANSCGRDTMSGWLPPENRPCRHAKGTHVDGTDETDRQKGIVCARESERERESERARERERERAREREREREFVFVQSDLSTVGFYYIGMGLDHIKLMCMPTVPPEGSVEIARKKKKKREGGRRESARARVRVCV